MGALASLSVAEVHVESVCLAALETVSVLHFRVFKLCVLKYVLFALFFNSRGLN